MEVEGRELGPARTNFNDYVGTVAADDAEAVLDRPSLYELAQIDRDGYTIVAVDLTVDGPVTAIVYAIDRVEHRILLNGTDLVELGQRSREIPVVQFNLPEPNVDDFIRHAFKRISVRLVTQTLRDQVLVVSELRPAEDLGLQGIERSRPIELRQPRDMTLKARAPPLVGAHLHAPTSNAKAYTHDDSQLCSAHEWSSSNHRPKNPTQPESAQVASPAPEKLEPPRPSLPEPDDLEGKYAAG